MANDSAIMDPKRGGMSRFVYADNGEPKPWHGCGLALPAGVKPSEAMARDPLLSSPLSLVPMQTFHAGSMSMVDVPGNRAVVRDFDGKVLDVVGNRYRLIQPMMMAGVLDTFAEAGARFDVAGLLADDSCLWAGARVNGEADLGPLPGGGRDVVRPRILLSNGFTGKRKFRIGMVSTRAVCENTIAHANAELDAAGATIRHVGDVAVKLEDAAAAVAIAIGSWEAFRAFAEAAVGRRVSKNEARGLIEALIPDPVKADASTAKAQAKRDAIFDRFESGKGNRGQTAWDLYNGVTEWLTWGQPVRGETPEARQAARWESVTLGDGAEMAGQVQALLVSAW